MKTSMFLASIPSFVWIGLVGMVVCFLMGYLVVPSTLEEKKDFHKDARVKHDFDVVLWTAIGLAFMTVMVFLKYSMTMPDSLFLKLLILPLVIAGTIGLTILFWGISAIATNMYFTFHHK